MSIRRATGLVCTCMLAAAPLRSQEAGPVRVTERGILLDFQDVDLRVVLTALAEAGGLNLIYAELPQRRMTLRTNEPVAPENVRALLLSIAASNGLTATEEGGFIRIAAADRDEPAAAPEGAAAPESDLLLYVYRLKHARAPQLASTLQALFGGGPGRRAGRLSGGSRPASLSERLRQQRIPPIGDTEGMRVDVELAPTPAPALPGELRGEIQIVPDEVTNSLLVRAQEADWQVVRQAIEALDLRPLQVLIEVTIAEVRRTRQRDIGFSVQGLRGDSAIATADPGAGNYTVRLRDLEDLDVDLALSLLSSTGDVRILSRPVLLAQNNQEAKILIGAERPFIQVFRSLPTEGAIRDQIVQYRDVGTSLTIVPTINPDGYVNLQVTQEVSNATNETQFGAPVISTREASTHLLARDSQTVVIGGLVDHQQDESEAGIPILKDIPLLGLLFRSDREFTTQSELFLFLTPYIVRTDEDMDRIREGIERGSQLFQGDTLPASVLRPRRGPGSAAPPDTGNVRR